MHTKFWSENLNGRSDLDDRGTDARLLLEWILEKQSRKV